MFSVALFLLERTLWSFWQPGQRGGAQDSGCCLGKVGDSGHKLSWTQDSTQAQGLTCGGPLKSG